MKLELIAPASNARHRALATILRDVCENLLENLNDTNDETAILEIIKSHLGDDHVDILLARENL